MTCPTPKDCDWQTTDRLTSECAECGLVDHQATRFLREWLKRAVTRAGLRSS